MRHLLCRLGFHASTWRRIDGGTDGWLRIRTCRRCGHHLRKGPR